MKKCFDCGWNDKDDIEYAEDFKHYLCCTCYYKRRESIREQTMLVIV